VEEDEDETDGIQIELNVEKYDEPLVASPMTNLRYRWSDAASSVLTCSDPRLYASHGSILLSSCGISSLNYAYKGCDSVIPT
jgi:hypothetical protein